MLEAYEVDTVVLKYWIAGLIIVIGVGGIFLVDLPDFFSQDPGVDENQGTLAVVPQEEPLSPGQLSRVRVVEGDSRVEGAEVRLDDIYIGNTNSEGIISFEALENDFNITATINDTQASKLVNVEEDADSEENSEFVDSEPDQDSDSSDDSTGSDESEDQTGSEDSDQDDSDQEDDSDSEPFTGFRLDEDAVAGEPNTVRFLIDGETQGNEEFTINGEEAETMPTGSYTFTVPNAQNLEFQASDVSSSFQVEGYEDSSEEIVSGDITPSFERSGPEYAGETVKFDASATESQNPIEAYIWTFDHENFNDTLQGEVIEYNIPEEGAYDIQLEVEDSEGFTETDTDYMKAEPEYSRPEITLTSPSDGDTVEAEEEFEFQVDNARRGQTAYIIIEGREESSTQLEPGLNIFEGEDALLTPISEEGVQNYHVEVTDEGGAWESSERQIENTRSYNDFGTFTVENPADGAEVSGETTFEFSFDLQEDVQLRVRGNSKNEDFSNSTFIEQSENSYSYTQDLNSSQYQWQASITVPDTTERKSSDERNLTVN